MRNIEPDLLPDRVPDLPRIYAWESPLQQAQRMAWYRQAIELYDRIYADVAAMFAGEARRVRQGTRRSAGTREGEQRGEELEGIERIIDRHLSDDRP